MLKEYGKTADEWGELTPEVRHFHEVAWQAEQDQRQEGRDRIESEF